MTIESQVKQILAVVTAQTQAISELTKAVTSNQGGSVDVSGIQASLDKLNAGVADIQQQLEGDGTPAPTGTDTPAA